MLPPFFSSLRRDPPWNLSYCPSVSLCMRAGFTRAYGPGIHECPGHRHGSGSALAPVQRPHFSFCSSTENDSDSGEGISWKRPARNSCPSCCPMCNVRPKHSIREKTDRLLYESLPGISSSFPPPLQRPGVSRVAPQEAAW